MGKNLANCTRVDCPFNVVRCKRTTAYTEVRGNVNCNTNRLDSVRFGSVRLGSTRRRENVGPISWIFSSMFDERECANPRSAIARKQTYIDERPRKPFELAFPKLCANKIFG